MQKIYEWKQEPKYQCSYCGSQHNNDSECPECNVKNHSNGTYE